MKTQIPENIKSAEMKEDKANLMVAECIEAVFLTGSVKSKKRPPQRFIKHKKCPDLARMKGQGNWYVYKTIDKKDYRFSLKTPHFAEAKTLYLNWLGSLDKDKPVTEGCLASMIGDYLVDKEGTCKKGKGTFRVYRHACDRLEKYCPYIMTTPCEQLDREKILQEWNSLEEGSEDGEEGYALETLKKTRTTLYHLVDLAIEKGLLPPKQTLFKKLRLPDADTTLPDLPTWPVFLRIRQKLAKNTIFLSPESFPFFEVCWQSGGRQTSVNSVLVEDINYNAKTLHFRKGKTGPYTIPLFSDLRVTVKRQIERFKREPGQNLFSIKSINGALATACIQVQKEIQAELRAAGMSEEASLIASVKQCPVLTHHKLRHIFATHALEKGTQVEIIARWLGHKDGGSLARRVYEHVRTEFEEKAARRMCFLSEEYTPEGLKVIEELLHTELLQRAKAIIAAKDQEALEQVVLELQAVLESPRNAFGLAPEKVLCEPNDPNSLIQQCEDVVKWITQHPAGISMKRLAEEFPSVPKTILKKAMRATRDARLKANQANRQSRQTTRQALGEFVRANPGVKFVDLKRRFPEVPKSELNHFRTELSAGRTAIREKLVSFARQNPSIGPWGLKKHFGPEHPTVTTYGYIQAVEEARGGLTEG